MADVVYQLDATGGNKVQAEAAKAEKAMNGVQRGSSKAGMAMLEASRGIEDFAMAGMRGVMNNIPGFLQNLGVGMGLTGVVSVATIAVWKGVEALEAYMNKLHDAKMNKFALPMPSLNYSSIEADFLERAVELAVQYKAELDDISKQYTFIKSIEAFKSEEKALESKLSLVRELIFLEKLGAGEDLKNIEKIESELDALDEELKLKRQLLVIDRRHKNELAGAVSLQEKSVQAANEAKAKMDEINQKAWAAGAKEYQRLYDLRENPPAQTVAGAASGAYTQGIAGKTLEMTDEEMIAAQHAEVERVKKQLLGDEESLLKSQIESGVEAQESLKVLRESLKEKQESLRLAEAEFASEEKKFKLKKDLAKAEKEYSDLQKRTDAENKRFERMQKDRAKADELQKQSIMSQRVTDVSPFLTSQGRAGLSGKETQSAMGLIGIARQQLTSLKRIEQNTRKLKLAYS
jgi:hypothetical protein